MTPNTWTRIDDAFQKVLTLVGSEREAFLRDLLAEDPEVAQEVVRLLEADDLSDDAILSPIASSILAMSDDTPDPLVGRCFGDWTTTGRIAVGGMGAVFLAQRSDEHYEQRAAIKVMASQLVTKDAVARFWAERQILANLNHPYIAKLLDGGATEEGLPYLTMEYVSGLPIDKYCDHHRLNIAQRMRLFQKVCSAVDYAHRQLVVHRDLKPSNILVDENGDPKLLDFGIAKLLDADAYKNTIAVTRQGARAMTPDYASPEQVRGDPVSVATDVYALGVLLYKLLSGRTPFSAVEGQAASVIKAILDEEPSRPSVAITRPPADANVDVSVLRRTSYSQLKSTISGDLDNIVLMALRKEPERRYPTAASLADDVDNFLEHRPVAARRNDLLYTAGKFVRRHRAGVAVTAVVAILSVVAVVQVVVERDRAQFAADRATQVSQFLTELFESASPNESRGTEITARELLDAGVNNIGDLADQPRLQGELYTVMGQSYTSLGYLDEAIEILSTAYEQKLAEGEALAIAETQRSLAEALRQRRDLEDAEANQRDVIEIYERELGRDSDRYSYSVMRLGVILFDQRRHEDAVAAYDEALQIKQRMGTMDDSAGIDLLGNYSNVLSSMGDVERAAEMADRAVELSIRTLGEGHPSTIIRMHNRGLIASSSGDLELATEIFARTVELGRQTWPEHHPQIAFMVGGLGSMKRRSGDFDEARRLYDEKTESTRIVMGEESIDYVSALRARGFLLIDMAKYAEAEDSFRDALELLARLDALDHYHYPVVNVGIGMTLNRRGRFAEAEQQFMEALKNRDRMSTTTQHITQSELAEATSGQGRTSEAETLFSDTLQDTREQVGDDSLTLTRQLIRIAVHYRQKGDLEAARRYIDDAVRIADANWPRSNWSSALIHAELGSILVAQGDRVAGRRELEAAASALEEVFGPDDPRVIAIREELSRVLN